MNRISVQLNEKVKKKKQEANEIDSIERNRRLVDIANRSFSGGKVDQSKQNVTILRLCQLCAPLTSS